MSNHLKPLKILRSDIHQKHKPVFSIYVNILKSVFIVITFELAGNNIILQIEKMLD